MLIGNFYQNIVPGILSDKQKSPPEKQSRSTNGLIKLKKMESLKPVLKNIFPKKADTIPEKLSNLDI